MTPDRHSLGRRWMGAFLSFIVVWALSAAVAQFDRRQQEERRWEQVKDAAQVLVTRLSDNLNALLTLNRTFAERIATDQITDDAQLSRLAETLFAGEGKIVSVTLARDLRVVFAYPAKGNEAVLGLNYATHPEIMVGVSKAIEHRETVVTGPIKLVQNGRLGVIGRRPIFQEDRYWGLVSVAIDLDGLLEQAMPPASNPGFAMALRGLEGSGAQGEIFFGRRDTFAAPHFGLDIPIPGGQWRLAMVPDADLAGPRQWLILGTGLGLALLVACSILFSKRQQDTLDWGALLPRRQFSLRIFLMSALMLVLLPIVAITGGVSYRNAETAAEQLILTMASEVGERIQDRVLAFFDVPRRVVAFNQEYAQNGLLGENNRPELLRRLLLQIRQQPQLTFVSIGMADGEYYAGSRPPLGDDKGLRIMYARAEDLGRMQIYRVDDGGKPTTQLFAATTPFDARQRPWFKTAKERQSISWYPAYRYAIHDTEGAYATVGIGVSAPLYDPQGQFLGVATADVALSQLGQFLAELTKQTGGIAFIAYNTGELLASSIAQAAYDSGEGAAAQMRLSESENPVLKLAGAVIADRGQPEGSLFTEVAGSNWLIKWQSHQLASGPQIIIGVLLPKAGFSTIADEMLRNIIYLGLAVALFAVVIGLFATDWIARPLRTLSQSSARLATGDWSALPRKPGPIQEVATLYTAMEDMAHRVRAHSENLEGLVAERTQALAQAHQILTDSIDYARLIQNAILPDTRLAQDMPDSYFSLWLPRDVVGGDFYFYANKRQGQQLFALIDCAGHGVPGACMTMAVHAAIEVATQDTAWNNPAGILGRIEATVRTMLPFDARIVASIDASFCCFDPVENKLIFAAAHQSMFRWDGSAVDEFRGGRYSLNGRRTGSYDNTTLPVAAGHTYYLLSDGLLDQAGGEHGHSFGATRWREWILRHGHLPLDQQRLALAETIETYRGHHLQRDDISVFAFRLA